MSENDLKDMQQIRQERFNPSFGVGSFPTTKDIQKYKDIGAKEIYVPFRFHVNYFLEGECKLNENKKRCYREKIPLWIKQGFKVHIHTEQQGERSYPTPTYLGSDTESQNTVEKIKVIIDFMKELEENIKKEEGVEGKFDIVEVHSTAKSNISNKYEETLIKNLNELSDYAKPNGYKIGIEYGKEKTPFKRDVIESIWDKNKHSPALNSDVKLIFDVELCYRDIGMELVDFFEKNVNRICQIHWNNWNTKKRNGQHRPLFCHGGTISEKTLNKIALKAKEKHIESNLWECYGKLLDNPRMKKDLVFLQKYFVVNDEEKYMSMCR